MHYDFGMERRFVRIGDARELRDLAGDGLLVETFHVAAGHHLERALHVNLDEIVNARTQLLAHRPVRRNGGHYGDCAIAGEQFADEADAADVSVAIFLAEAQALAEVLAHHVAIQHLNFRTGVTQAFFDDRGDGALARAGEPGEPQRKALMRQERFASRISLSSTSSWRSAFPSGEK